MKFLLDTNFLLIPGTFGVDIFTELTKFGKPELYTIRLVIKELEKMATGKGADARAAKLALQMITQKNIAIIDTEVDRTDKEIEILSASEGHTVCTQDKALIEKLKKKGVRVIGMRQKKYLEEV